ncbi:MAG TPA: hypothetical protein VKM72_19065 [Thermoanaerobaculia bacterium]|nr:hypothetical protein [Thermoanaerobaculia bacterium]
MPIPQNHLVKSLADEMARQLSGNGGANAVLLLKRLELLTPPEPQEPSARPGGLGIWEAGPQGYEPSAALRKQWPDWANIHSIPLKVESKRVLLLGESVAAGFLYAPEFRPAQALEAALTTALGEPVEVIDLARKDLKAPELAELAGAAPTLDPDVLVVFAGNNWAVHGRQNLHLEAAVLREQGALGFKELREQRLAAMVDTLLQQFTELSMRLPIVVVIPEINLVDWRLDAEADSPWLPAGRNRRWLECRAAARSALASSRLDEAEALASEMVELDGGTAASGWTLLADCARARGDLAAARTCLEKARDAHIWDVTHQTPRVLSLTQQALRGCAMPGRIAVVDLPHCFADWQHGGLPDRRLFLDYCHLSSEGIRVAMAATALEVAALLDSGRPLPRLESLVNVVPPLSARLEATAHFAGAIHGAHWGQTGPFVSYLCHEAARRSSGVAQAMRAYLELQTRRAPTWACAAVERLSALATPFLHRYILQNLQNQTKLFDPVLLPAIAEALEDNGLPSRAFLEELRKEERALSDRSRDLLDPYHRASWVDLHWLEWPSHFLRVYTPTSRYPWVSRTQREVAFALTCRQTGAEGPGECQVRINGTCLAHRPLSATWSTLHFSAPTELVQSGVNWLEIHWPFDLPASEEEIKHIAVEHEHGRMVPLLPVFAEISSLSAVQR